MNSLAQSTRIALCTLALMATACTVSDITVRMESTSGFPTAGNSPGGAFAGGGAGASGGQAGAGGIVASGGIRVGGAAGIGGTGGGVRGGVGGTNAGTAGGGAPSGAASTGGAPSGGTSTGDAANGGGGEGVGAGAGGEASGGMASGGVGVGGGAGAGGGSGTGGTAEPSGGTTGTGGTSGAGGISGTGGKSDTGGDAGSSGGDGVAGMAGAGGGGGQPGEGGSGGAPFDPEDGLVTHFRFDETAGTIAVNDKHASAPATFMGSCTHPNGHYGRAVGTRNDGTLDWIELPSGLLSTLSAATIVFWFRDLSASRRGARFLSIQGDNNNQFFFVPDATNPSTSLPGCQLAGVRLGTAAFDLWSDELDYTQWTQVAVSWSAVSIDWYMNAVLVGSQPSPGIVPSDFGVTDFNWLGRAFNDSATPAYGEFDDLRIYNRPLSASEITELYLALA